MVPQKQGLSGPDVSVAGAAVALVPPKLLPPWEALGFLLCAGLVTGLRPALPSPWVEAGGFRGPELPGRSDRHGAWPPRPARRVRRGYAAGGRGQPKPAGALGRAKPGTAVRGSGPAGPG